MGCDGIHAQQRYESSGLQQARSHGDKTMHSAHPDFSERIQTTASLVHSGPGVPLKPAFVPYQ